VGFLARISAVLAAVGIPCNVVSAVHHDHLFVPEAQANAALATLQALETQMARGEAEAVYAVTVRLDAAVADEWVEWMARVHIPAVLATGCFSGCSMQREIEGNRAPGRETFVLEYRAASLERLHDYQREHAPALQQAHTARYAGRFDASRAVRTVTGAFQSAG
jgi:hypothetical protein